MAYSAEISRTNPTCFLFLIDQSGSMSDAIGSQSGSSKAEGVADAINRLLQNLIIKSSKSEGVRDYFHVGVIGYGEGVAPALGADLAGRPMVPISEIANSPLRIEQRTKKVGDGAGGLVDQPIKFPVWFEPTANGSTPMCEAFELARQTVADFIGQVPDCYPPLVVNITDGESTDGDPEAVATEIRGLTSSDGEVLLYNLHLSTRPIPAIQFPDNEEALPDDFAKRLFRMSSVLPSAMRTTVQREEFRVSETSRGFVFNADLVSVIQFLDIGTRIAQNAR